MKYFVILIIIEVLTIATLILGEEDACKITGNTLNNLEWVQENCNDILVEDFVLPAGETLSFTAIQPGTTIRFRGTTTFEYEEWDGFLIMVSGTNITVMGEPGNLLDCEGERWWDGLGGNGGKLKPVVFLAFNLYNSTITGINVRNSPRHAFFIVGSENVSVSEISLDDVDGDTQGGHNTDGFNLYNSTKVAIKDCNVVNQDDCISVKSGTDYYFNNNYCSGGHGISIGSVGNRTDNVVANVYVKNCTIVNSENGIRIKTKYNAEGEVRNVTYEDIIIANITDYGILVRGDYKNSGPTGTPTDGFSITEFNLINIQGWVNWNATNIYLLLVDGVASNWNWTNVSISGSNLTDVNCTGYPTQSTGVFC